MKPHRTDWLSLSFGLIFLTIVLGWQLSGVVVLRPAAVGWLAASALILFGMIGLLGALRSGRATQQPVPAADTAVEPGSDVPPELHADIVRELLTDPATRLAGAPPPATATSPADARDLPLEPAARERPVPPGDSRPG